MDNDWESLISNSFKTLIDTGKNYASFNNNEIKAYIQNFRKDGIREIMDPMSGYGTLTKIVNEDNQNYINEKENNISTYCVEINTPCYLWQFLSSPKNKNNLLKIIEDLETSTHKLPKINRLSEISSEYFTEYGLNLIECIYDNVCKSSKKIIDNKDSDVFALSLLIPYSSRLSTSSNGDIRHVKKGGMAIYKNYEVDFKKYIKKIKENIENIPNTNLANFELILGDSENFGHDEFNLKKNRKFESMITSPPYPNRADYERMFIVENDLLNILNKKGLIKINIPNNLPIGTPKVSGKKKTDIIWSNAVNEFIEKIESYNKNPKAASAARTYYAPYFRNYFYELQTTYSNIAKYCDNDFKGIIVVRDNYSKGNLVPVHEFIKDTWTHLGFDVKIPQPKEMHHVGLKNKNVHGKKMATQDEYDIQIMKGKYDSTN